MFLPETTESATFGQAVDAASADLAARAARLTFRCAVLSKR
jgi:hypothetical protein